MIRTRRISDGFFIADCRAGLIPARLSNYLHNNYPLIDVKTVLLGHNKQAVEWFHNLTTIEIDDIYRI